MTKAHLANYNYLARAIELITEPREVFTEQLKAFIRRLDKNIRVSFPIPDLLGPRLRLNNDFSLTSEWVVDKAGNLVEDPLDALFVLIKFLRSEEFGRYVAMHGDRRTDIEIDENCIELFVVEEPKRVFGESSARRYDVGDEGVVIDMGYIHQRNNAKRMKEEMNHLINDVERHIYRFHKEAANQVVTLKYSDNLKLVYVPAESALDFRSTVRCERGRGSARRCLDPSLTVYENGKEVRNHETIVRYANMILDEFERVSR